MRRTLMTLAALPLLLVPLACATSPDEGGSVEARDGDGPVDARHIELVVPADHASHEAIGEIAEFIEGQADVAGAKVKVRKEAEDGDATVEVTLWGQDLPTDEDFVADLSAEFPFLSADAIAVTAVDIAAEPMPGKDDAEAEDPDVLRENIIADLRAKGVEGEIDVEITDHPDGRREVEVTVHDDEEG